MICHIEKCPNCGNNVQGEPQIDQIRQLTRKGVSSGTNYLFKKIIIGILAPIIGTVILPAFGTFIGFIILFVLFYQGQKYADKVSYQVDKNLYQHINYSFKCPNCGNQWTMNFQTGLSNMPDDVLEEIKAGKVNEAKGISQFCGILGLIVVLLLIYGLYYCITKDSRIDTGETYSTWFGSFEKYDCNYWWYMWGLVVIFSFIMSCIMVPLWLKYLGDYFTLKKMGLQEIMRKYFS